MRRDLAYFELVQMIRYGFLRQRWILSLNYDALNEVLIRKTPQMLTHRDQITLDIELRLYSSFSEDLLIHSIHNFLHLHSLRIIVPRSFSRVTMAFGK